MTSTAARRVAGFFADPDAHSDADLLGRFVADRDSEAFAALVSRHGPMVFRVCRRVLGDWHLAEDAFQAAFVVLARRAAAVSPPGAVAGWLHGVAHRVAKDARRTALRRFRRERPVDEFPDPPVEPPTADGDLRGVLDDELHRLPGKFRVLLVACDLEGRPRQPVAQGLGIPEGTLSSRLTTARKMLAERLARRGIAPAVVAAVAASGPPAGGCEVPRALLASAARIGSADPGTVPAVVAALANGAIRAMTVRTYLPWAAVLLVTGVGLAATWPDLSRADPDATSPLLALLSPSASRNPAGEKAGPLPQGPNKILVSRSGHLTLIDPDGKNETKVVKADNPALDPEDFRLSPDGKRVAVLAYVDRDGGDFGNKKVLVRELGKDGPWTDLGPGKAVFWSGDGTELLIADSSSGKAGNGPPAHRVVNLATGARTPVKLPAGHTVTDWSRDGKLFLTTQNGVRDDGKGGKRAPRVCAINRDGTGTRAVTDGTRECVVGKFSPDGNRVLFMEVETPERQRPEYRKLTVVDLDTGKATPVEGIPPDADLLAYCWGPDSKRIAYSWRKVFPDETVPNDQEAASFLVVCDADGKNAKTVITEKVDRTHDGIVGVDWR